jgi:hypothetical protein
VFNNANVKQLIINLNREKQLYVEGVGVNGEIVGTYTYFTQLFTDGISGKGFPKRTGSPYNFYNTGEMYASFVVIVDKDGFTIDANAEKLVDSQIIDNEKEILGLTDESKIELAKEAIPQVARQIREALLS